MAAASGVFSTFLTSKVVFFWQFLYEGKPTIQISKEHPKKQKQLMIVVRNIVQASVRAKNQKWQPAHWKNKIAIFVC